MHYAFSLTFRITELDFLRNGVAGSCGVFEAQVMDALAGGNNPDVPSSRP
jgi:hypothetical protein